MHEITLGDFDTFAEEMAALTKKYNGTRKAFELSDHESIVVDGWLGAMAGFDKAIAFLNNCQKKIDK